MLQISASENAVEIIFFVLIVVGIMESESMELK